MSVFGIAAGIWAILILVFLICSIREGEELTPLEELQVAAAVFCAVYALVDCARWVFS